MAEVPFNAKEILSGLMRNVENGKKLSHLGRSTKLGNNAPWIAMMRLTGSLVGFRWI